MSPKEEKYLQDKLALIRAVVLGSLWGAYMYPKKDFGESARYQLEKAMEVIESDVRKVYKYAKKQKC